MVLKPAQAEVIAAAVERRASIDGAQCKVTMMVSNDNINVSDPSTETRESGNELNDEAKSLKRIARETVKLVEKKVIVDALSKTGGNVTQAAKALGVSRATLQNKMKAYGLRG